MDPPKPKVLRKAKFVDIVIGIGEYAISNNEEDVIKTFSLGSCVALTIYCPKNKVLGMVHIALPDSNINLEESKNKPGHFADTAIPLLLDTLSSKYGCNKYDLVCNMYGGSNSIQNDDNFQIGKRNIDSVLNILGEKNVTLNKCDTGGFISRTIEADVKSGTVKLSSYPIKF